ncbi:3-phosphoglycerate dehydrogenase [Cryomorpha ignava]|uniref:3-phosphoglycerate dehydrogenase n=1 Tax=Cryomorpha ignava TaxID=101383 RepID=A0A7K3WSK7_9FLAO|nr:D-2-hydroxyacid dehydrogenase [Cryomorpha ignava]NEN24677.1 3-phosphoglycerate dehydrogenase [Cryomorpha ignava]
MIVLANDGISPSGKQKLEAAGFKVVTDHVPQEKLADYINNNDVVALCVRSATTARKELIDACPNLKFIGRGGVGMDNIDVEYARDKGITVANTPASSSQSVAELVMAHLFSLARFTYDANREMPTNGHSDFKALKKKYAKGIELRGKTLGIVGFGRIGQAVAQYALGCGMHVICADIYDVYTKVSFVIHGHGEVVVDVEKVELDELIRRSDAISIHVPKQADGSSVIDSKEIAKMKKGVLLVNAARGGVIDEPALLSALSSGHVAGAALDVFENEPTPSEGVLSHDKLALSPHIGAATLEAQDRIGEELADLIMAEMTTA